MRRSAPKALAVLLCTFAIACTPAENTDQSADTASADTATSTGVAATPPGVPEQLTEASITVADIDAWKRGMEAELQAVRQAGEALRSAKTSQDSLDAIFRANDMSTRAAGARAVGLDEERYGLIRTYLSNLAANMAPIENELDMSKAGPEMVTALKAARDTSLMREAPKFDQAVVNALRPRAAALRKQDLELTVARLKAAGMAQ